MSIIFRSSIYNRFAIAQGNQALDFYSKFQIIRS